MKNGFKNKIAVIGSEGYIGQSICSILKDEYSVIKYDISLGSENSTHEQVNESDLAIICVPTPMSNVYIEIDGIKVYKADTSIVEEVVSWVDTPVIMIKSTVPVGTTEYLKEKYKKRIVFSPEYLSETKYYVDERYKLQQDVKSTPQFVVGGNNDDCNYVIDLLLPALGPAKKYFKTDSKTAEFIKYKANDFLAHKVIWANEAKEEAISLGVDWYNAWLGWGLDPRMDTMHTAVFNDNKGFAGSCFPKDLNALAYSCTKNNFVPDLLISVLKKNLKLRNVKDYQEISGRKDKNDTSRNRK